MYICSAKRELSGTALRCASPIDAAKSGKELRKALIYLVTDLKSLQQRYEEKEIEQDYRLLDE